MSREREAQDHAAYFIVAREEPGWSEEHGAELEAWLAESDLNRIAFLRLEHSWREADRLRALRSAVTPSMLQGQRQQRSPVRRVSWWVSAAAAASLVVTIGLGSYRSSIRTTPTKVATARFEAKIGDRRIVALADGSKIELNTASVIHAAVDKGRREVWLDKGEAYFEVKHDPTRPFVVHAGDRQVTDLGTKFSVRRDGDRVSVFVRQGRVRVDDIEDEHVVRSTTITAGDIALARGAATLVTGASQKRVTEALAWREGMLSFDQERLADIAAEFNRYNRQQLVVTDRAAAELRIGGMFPAEKPDDFVRLLRDAYGLKVEEGPQTIRISS